MLQDSDTFKSKYSELLQDGMHPQWKPVTLIRWSVTLLILVFLRDTYALQIQLLIFSSVVFQGLLLMQGQGKDIVFFNEVANSVYLYVVMLLTDFHGDTSMRDQFGQALVLVLGVTVAVNFAKLISKVA